MSHQADVANSILKILSDNGSDLNMAAKDDKYGDPYLFNSSTGEPLQSLAYDSAKLVLIDIARTLTNLNW